MTYDAPFTGGIVQPSNTSYLAVTISANYSPSWPSVAADTPNVVANINAVTATVGGLNIVMPPANQVGVATPAIWINTGAQTFTLVDQNNNTILAITAGQVWFVYLTDDSTVQGTWATFQFSATTSQATPGPLAGAGLVAIGATLNQSHPVEFTAVNGYTVSATDRSQVLVWNGGAGTVNLPSAAAIGNNFFLLFRNDGTGIETIAPNGADLIDGSATQTLNPSESIILVSSGSGWIGIGYGRSVTITTTQVLVNVAGNSNVTLTTAQAANLLIQPTGALTGSIAIIVPTSVATYHFFNNTTGNFQITVRTLAGTGIVVPQGTHAILDCDGTNVVNAMDGFISGALIKTTVLTGAYPTVAADRGTFFECTSGAPFTVTLLSAITATNGYYVIVRNETSGSITLTPAAGNIGGSTSLVLTPGDCVYAVSDGANYQMIWQSPYRRLTVFTVNGTFTVPAGVWQADVEGWGSGGSGGGGTGGSQGTGGGAASYGHDVFPVTPAAAIAVVVGAATVGGVAGVNGVVGNLSSFNATTLSNGGGAGQQTASASVAGGAAAALTEAIVGGASASVPGGVVASGSDGGSAPKGGSGGRGGGGLGGSGVAPGGGGAGGGAATAGGNGAAGRVVVRF